MKKLTIVLWSILFCVTLWLVIAGKNRDLWRKWLSVESQSGKYGWDLYQMLWIDEFKQNYTIIPKNNLEESDIDLDGYDIWLMWDSFAETELSGARLGSFLASKFGDEILLLNNVDVWYLDPRRYLEKIWYTGMERKILVLETVERYSWNRGMEYGNYSSILSEIVWGLLWEGTKNFTKDWTSGNEEILKQVQNDETWLTQVLLRWQEILFDNEFVNYFWRNNKLIFPVYHWLMEKRWEWFGWSNDKVHIGKDGMLFLQEALDFAEMEKTDEDLEVLAENILGLKNDLKRVYNIDLVFMIIPDKSTVYLEYLDYKTTYDDYIPRLQEKLEQKWIEFVDVYQKYLDYRADDDSDLLYLKSDTHFTKVGKSLSVEGIMGN